VRLLEVGRVRRVDCRVIVGGMNCRDSSNCGGLELGGTGCRDFVGLGGPDCSVVSRASDGI
jgi:hypothetical protein